MPKADGSIIIDTKIVTKRAEAQLISLENRMIKSAKKAESLRAEMDKLKDEKIPTAGYAALEKELGKITEKYDKLAQNQSRFLSTGGKEGSSTYKRMEYDLDLLEEKQDKVIAKMREMEAAGKAFTLGKDTAQYADLSKELSYQLNEQNAMEQKHAALTMQLEKAKAAAEAAAESIQKEGTSAKNAAGSMDELATKKGKATASNRSLKGSAGETSAAITKESASAKRGATFFGKLSAAARNAFSSIKKSAKSSNGFFKGGLGNILKYAIGIRSLYALFGKLREAAKEGFSNLYNSGVGGFKGQIDELKASLLTFKNALATAFAPIVTTVIPYIQQLVSWLTTAANSLAQFFAALTGQKTYTKAVKQTTGALKEQAGAAKKTKNALAGFDDLDVLNKQDSGGSGGGANAAASMFEEVPIEDKWKNIIDKIKDMWKKADFTELGRDLGESLKTALDSIPWGTIQKNAKKAAKSVATLINGFVETPGLAEAMGNSIGEAFNTITGTVDTFLTETHFDSIGKLISGTIFESIKSMDFTKIGSLVSHKLVALLKFLMGLIQGVPWRELPGLIIHKIIDFFKGFDFVGVMEAIGGLIGAIVKAVIDLLLGIWDAILEAAQSGTDYLMGYIEEAGGDIVQGIFNGITDAIKNIRKWIQDNIFKPFLDGFKEAFGIHSPSKVMKEQGGYIISGLIKGIVAKVRDLVAKIGEVKGKMLEKLSDLKDKFFEKGSAIISGIREGIRDKWDTLSELLKNKKESILGKFSGIKKSFKNVGEKIINGIIEGIGAIWDKLVERVKSLKELFSFDINLPSIKLPSIGGGSSGSAKNTRSTFSVPAMAGGGITTGSVLARIGEAGREAVLPLENNLGYLDEFAGKIANKISSASGGKQNVVVYIGNDKLDDYIVRYSSMNALRTGGI